MDMVTQSPPLDMTVLGAEASKPPTMPPELLGPAAGIVSAMAANRCVSFEAVAMPVLAGISDVLSGTRTVGLANRWGDSRPLIVMQIGAVADARIAIQAVSACMPPRCAPFTGASALPLRDFRKSLTKARESGTTMPLCFAAARADLQLDAPTAPTAPLAHTFARAIGLRSGERPLSSDARATLEMWLSEPGLDTDADPVAEFQVDFRFTAADVAVVLEALWWAAAPEGDPPVELSGDAVVAAIAMVECYLIPSLRHLLREGGMCGRDSGARILARWLLADGPEAINVRQLRRSGAVRSVGDARAWEAAVEELVAAGWLLPATHSGAGRPRGDYHINPALVGEAG